MSGFNDDPIPAGRFASLNVVEALRSSTHMPVEAIELALRAPGRLAEPVLHVVSAAAHGAVLVKRDHNLLFWGVHVLGAARDARLFAPLLRLLRRPADDVAELMGEAVGATLPRIVASVFDGDTNALETALADSDVDEAVRWSLFGALAFLTADGRIERARTRAFLVRFDAERPARAGDAAWAGWEAAIALLGFADLAPRVATARADARLLDDGGGEDWFAATLAEAVAQPDDRARFNDAELGYVEDVIAELEAALDDAAEAEPLEPVRNALRDVGRNDPCPCGSGKKYKKCCLPSDGIKAPLGP